jgi:hypothetical protein
VKKGNSNMKKIILSLASILSVFASVTTEAAPNRFFVDPSFPSEVQAAHELYYQGKFDAMALEIKAALLKYPNDDAIRRDLLSLFDSSYELRGNGAISPDWKLPKGVTWMSAAFKKRMNSTTGVIRHRFAMSINFAAGSDVEQVRVVRYPNQVLIDKQAGIGRVDYADEPNNERNIWVASPNQHDPVGDGLFLFDLKMSGGETLHGWFIGSRTTPSDSPEVLSPTPNQIVTDAQPTFSWKNYVSSDYRNYEVRRVFVAASLANANDDAYQRMSSSKETPPTSIQVDKPLVSGDSVMRVSYRERRTFGPLTLSRESDTAQLFTLKTSN